MPTLGGPLFSLLMTFLLIFLYRDNSITNQFWKHMMMYSILTNAAFFISTILPVKYLNNISDGMDIINILKSTEDNLN